MSTREIQEQRKIPVGGENAPTYIGEFHQRYGDEPQQYHSYCREHADFGTCGSYSEAMGAARKHLIEAHRDFVTDVQLDELRKEFAYRLETVAAYALNRGRYGESVDQKFLEEQVDHAVSHIAMISTRKGY